MEIKEKELFAELEKIGIYTESKLTIGQEDIDALLAGRRTGMLSLKNLELDGFKIQQLDAKLSMVRGDDKSIVLNLHPIYNEVRPHPALSEREGKRLKDGKVDTILKEHGDTIGMLRKIAIEYDAQTREFISYEPEKVQVPDRVNGESLSEKQKKAFRNGEIVTLQDGTRIQHSATDSKGVRSDRARLIFSMLFDGGISYLIFRGIRNLKNSSEAQKLDYTKGYNQALADILEKEKPAKTPTVMDMPVNNIPLAQHERSYFPKQSR